MVKIVYSLPLNYEGLQMAYFLPEGPNVISFSGGRTSAYMLIKYLEQYDGILPADTFVIFQNTGKEVYQTLDFVHEIEKRYNVPIIWLEYDLDQNNKPISKVVNYDTCSRNGEPFEKLIIKRHYLPNATERFCTSELKILTAKRYMVKLGHKKWHSATGFRYDEYQRVNKKTKPDTRITPFYPLFDNKITKHDISEYWLKAEFDLKLPNIDGTTPLGNCDGCFLKSEKTKAYVCKHLSESAEWWAQQEKLIGGVFRDKQPWQQLIDFVGLQGEFNFSDHQDMYCDSDLGGCTDY